jgi:predicted nucleic acid-binding protein
MTLIIDTGFLYATFDDTDKHHRAVTKTIRHVRNERLILPTPTIIELGLLMNNRLGRQATSRFISDLEKSPVVLEPLDRNDFSRIGELLFQYQAARLDFVDAAITAMAERLNIRRILTVDQRDFRMIRPRHCEYFEILP